MKQSPSSLTMSAPTLQARHDKFHWVSSAWIPRRSSKDLLGFSLLLAFSEILSAKLQTLINNDI